MILADEMEADWSRVQLWQAPGDETKYDPAGKDAQNTDGSRSTRHHLDIMRNFGAAARQVLEAAAAKKWNVDASEVYAKSHQLHHTPTGRSLDFACEAAILSKMIGAPVRVQWTREDEIRNGYHHAASAHAMKAVQDDKGKVTAWHHSGSWPSILGLWNPAQKTGFPVEYGLGLIDTPYNEVPNLRIENGEADIHTRIGWYRSVNNIQHAFAMNSFVHELATNSGRDFEELMLGMIGESPEMDLTKDGIEKPWNYGDSPKDWPIMPNRLSNVLRRVAEKSGYGKELPKGHGLGLACHRAFHSYVATAVHVAVSADGTITVPQVDMAIDCGRYVNPEGCESRPKVRPYTGIRWQCTAKSPRTKASLSKATSTITR
ncbi:MAG: xanthine dehydrogenase family protein molybdopterin-binding subunit [Chromatiales bacterium]|jgi:CO/xanthine dehydrogenase Mo-binding subunit|nr:xanthine dehydrogenase family protein molybdopterin-binding subunit [Chromatiales bacterium]